MNWLLALAPMAGAAALALLVLPFDPRRIFVVDEAHRDRLAGLAGPGRDAPSRLHDALVVLSGEVVGR
ncbi:hypothetical protein ACWDQL_15980 [Streptomyces olivaceus]